MLSMREDEGSHVCAVAASDILSNHALPQPKSLKELLLLEGHQKS